MKKLFILLASLALAAPALAQKESVFNEDDTWNLYSKPILAYTTLGEDEGLMGGLEIGGIVNEKMAIGLRGYVLAEDLEPAIEGFGNADSGDLMYGGLNLEYTFYGDQLFHASLGLLVGYGEIKFGNGNNQNFPLAEPALNLMINFTPATEMGLGVGYRWAESDDLDTGDIGGVVASLFIRFKEF